MWEAARLALGDVGLLLSVVLAIAAVVSIGRRIHSAWETHRRLVTERRRKVDTLLELHELTAALKTIPDRLGEILKQLHPDGGSSLSDQVSRIELEVHRMSRRLDLALAQSDMAQAWADEAGNWSEISRAMQRQIGRGADELIGRGWYDSIDELERGEVIRRFEEAVRDHREFEHVFSWQKPDATFVLVRMAAWYVPKAKSYIVNCRKLDQKRWAEEQEYAARTRRRRGDPDVET